MPALIGHGGAWMGGKRFLRHTAMGVRLGAVAAVVAVVVVAVAVAVAVGVGVGVGVVREESGRSQSSSQSLHQNSIHSVLLA